MLNLIKPAKLSKGDLVATVSLSWGGAGDRDLLWRYDVGKERLKELGLRVIEMENTLKGTEYIYNHPEQRAKDLMQAFLDTEIKAIFTCIGGDDSIRMLPYIDFDVIRNNPKIFIGYSDTTITHLICLKAGISSFYGPSILAEFAENIEIFPYTLDYINRVLFEDTIIGKIDVAKKWTEELIEWLEENSHIRKELKPNKPYEFLQGKGIVNGPLIGGCMDTLEMAKDTVIWPEIDKFEGAILFLETSEDCPHPNYVEWWLRNYGAQEILQKVSGIIFGKPYQEKYYEEYKTAIKKVILDLGLYELPIIYNMSFGHNQPMCILPYGANAKIDCEDSTFTITENGVV